MSSTLVDLLREIGPGEGVVFKNTKGEPYGQPPEAFRKAVATLGLNEGRDRLDRLVFHSLRHTGATRLGQKIPLRNLMDVGGWKTPSMALRYQHTEDQEKRAALAVLENMTQVEPAKVIDLFGKG